MYFYFINSIITPNTNDFDLTLFYYLPNDINVDKVEIIHKYITLQKVILIENDIELQIPNIKYYGRQGNIDKVSSPGIKGYLQQIYGIEKVYNMVMSFEKQNKIQFDYIVRVRSDVIFKDSIHFGRYNMSKIVVPKFHSFFGINDRFAMGNRENMSIYMSMYSNIYKLKPGCELRNAEYFCKMNLNENNIPYEENENIIFKRIRMGGYDGEATVLF